MKNTRKTTKRILALVLALITALSAISVVSFSASAAGEKITYTCNFDLWGHATQNVYVKINGTSGSTDFYNARDIGYHADHKFSFTDVNVGEIQSITVKNVMGGCILDGPVNQFLYLNEWAFKSVTINGVKIYGGEYISGLNEHTFSVTDNVYKVTIKTADVKNAGTDLNVNVTLNGENGKKSETINMSEDGLDTTPTGIYLNAFERGHQQTTLIRAPFDKLQSITIELSGGMIAAKGWKCESITAEQVQGGTEKGAKTIVANQWFATEDDNYMQTLAFPLDKNANGDYMVSDFDDLCQMATMINNNESKYRYETYVLTNDIDCTGESFTRREMIGTKDVQFNGIFDGQGYTISNLNNGAQVEGKDAGHAQGLFASIGKNGMVKNLTVANASVWSDDSMLKGSGVIAKQNNGLILDCTVKNSRVQLGNSDYLGGIAGVNNGTIEGTRVENTTLMRRWGGCGNRAMGNICEVNNGTVKACEASGCSFRNGSVSDSTLLVATGNQPV